MNRVPVESSNLKSVGHDPVSLTLEIEFQNGNIYQYFDVPQTVHVEMMQAPSLGKFFAAQIKGQYRFAKV